MSYDFNNRYYAHLWLARERANMHTRDCVDTRPDKVGTHAHSHATAARKLSWIGYRMALRSWLRSRVGGTS